MANKKPKKKKGAVHSGGKTALSFKKGSKNYSETQPKRKKDKDPLRSPAQTRKPIDPNRQNRASGESIQDFMKRREKNRQKN